MLHCNGQLETTELELRVNHQTFSSNQRMYFSRWLASVGAVAAVSLSFESEGIDCNPAILRMARTGHPPGSYFNAAEWINADKPILELLI